MAELEETSYPNEVPEGHPYRLLGIGFLLAVLYFLAYGFHGMSDTDQGFISALSYRVLQGEIPYVDFIYIRPPLSLYLHAFIQSFIPASLEILGERFIFYLFMALSVFWTIRGLQHFFDFRKIGISTELFLVMAFACSVHNFPPMAWHTIDGILFSSLGVYMVARRQKIYWHVFALFCFAAAALCKQAFYPMLVFGPALLFLQYGAKYAWKPAAIFGGIFLSLLGSIYLSYPEYSTAFLEQSMGESRLTDLVDVAIVEYAKPFLLIVLPLLIVWRAHAIYTWRYLPAGIFGLAFWGLLGMHVYQSLKLDAYVAPSFGFSQAFWLIAVGVAVKSFWLNRAAFSFLLSLLSIGWCAGISWGYANPMLFFTPILFAFIYGLNEELELSVPRYFYGVACILLIWVFAFLYQYPYRDQERDLLTAKPGMYVEKLTALRTGEPFEEKLLELKDYFEKYDPNRTAVLPGYPMAHYLFNAHNPLPVDWAHNAEMNYGRLEDQLKLHISEEVEWVLLEKEELDMFTEEDRYGSLLSGYVKESWIPADTGAYFWLMKNPKLEPTSDQ
ncbi:MAG: hypothetical protein AAGD28_01260 [Bacteroidota bacterium]